MVAQYKNNRLQGSRPLVIGEGREIAEAGEPILQGESDRLRAARARLGLGSDPGVHRVEDWTRNASPDFLAVDLRPATP